MSTITLWHNPRCTKSREGLALLRAAGAEVVERRYLDDPPDAAELGRVLGMLGMAPLELMRRREKLFRELGLGLEDDPDRLIAAMAAHPRLIERPVGIRGGRARLGRPPERLLELV